MSLNHKAKTPVWLAVLLLMILLAACDDGSDSDENNDTIPAPTSVPIAASNDAWTPVIETFNGVEMVLVPPGCFMMGSEEGDRDERPVSEICFEQAFWIDRFEVTNAQYGSPGAFEGDDQPRGNLTWFEARDFCQNRDVQTRLPTEAEWEFAARGPDNLLFPWGNNPDSAQLIASADMGQTAAVGSIETNMSWVGAFDLSGNVIEWVSSMYDRYPYDAADGREDMEAIDVRRVQRGSIYTFQELGPSATRRLWAMPDQRDWFVGFRCIRTVIESES